MAEQPVSFTSDGLRLSGVLHLPESGSGPWPAFLLLHGFGGTKNGAGDLAAAELLTSLGFAALRFDFRGCGESEGERAYIRCLDQVSDTRNAITYLQSQPSIERERIGVMGGSFGAAVAIYTGGVDDRVGAVVSVGGWGNGERKFRAQHPTPEAWARFEEMLAEGRRLHQRGERLMVARYDIVPIPEHLRHLRAPGGHDAFPWETAQSMFDFRADDVVGHIAPRPLLLLHASHDSVTPTRESIELFARAGRPTELHLFDDVDHFTRAERGSRVGDLLTRWLETYFPASSRQPALSA
jgi:pimeloyl-ACP methyl ester carboxylesterase